MTLISSSATNLENFRAKGFPGNLDKAIAQVGVRGLDREHAQGMIRLCDETNPILYGETYSSRSIRYQPGSRPELEKIVTAFKSASSRESALLAMKWVYDHVAHPHLIGPTRPDRALSEEDLIASGRGWCNEQARVFIALCQVMEIPSRLCFVNHENTVCGHTATEVFLDGRWAFFDVTFNVTVELPDGRLAEAREVSGSQRSRGHAAYRPALERYFQGCQLFVSGEPGWCEADRPTLEHGADLLGSIGICNYLIEGVEEVY